MRECPDCVGTGAGPAVQPPAKEKPCATCGGSGATAMKPPTPTTAKVPSARCPRCKLINWDCWCSDEELAAAAPHPTKPQPAYAPDHPKNLEDGTPCQYVSRAQPADITAKVERLFERWPEVAEADEHISQAMLDNTSTEISEEGGGMQSARTMVLCNYNDLRIVLGFVDKVRAAREALSSQRAEGIEEGLDYGPGSPWSEGYHSGHAAGWRAGARADILRLLRADLAEEDAERHAQRIAVIDDALTQDAG